MFKKFFGKKEVASESCSVESKPEGSKGYHTCIDSCERDIENLETECENLRKDNLTLIGKVTTLQSNEKTALDSCAASVKRVLELEKDVEEKDERIAELEKRLSEVDEKADGVPVKYASARKTMTKAKLAQLRKQLEEVPAGARMGGSTTIYDKKTKRLSVVQFTTKEEALEVLSRAEKGNVDIVL